MLQLGPQLYFCYGELWGRWRYNFWVPIASCATCWGCWGTIALTKRELEVCEQVPMAESAIDQTVPVLSP
eukprot:979992-Amphidinium_carterae.1